MYSIDEIENHLENKIALGLTGKDYKIIRQLRAERKEIRRQAFEEAAEIAETCWIEDDKHDRKRINPALQITLTLRRKAEEDIGNGGRIDDNDPDDISV